MKRLFVFSFLVASLVYAQDPTPALRLPVNQPTGSTYFMDIYVRHPLVMPLIRHHDYVFTEVTPDGRVNRSEVNWGWNASQFNPLRPFASLHRPVPGRMSTVAASEEHARHTPTITRHHQVQITAEAYHSERQHIREINAGQRGYTAIPRGMAGTDNCISAGIPPVLGTMRPGIGMFAAPRILRAMDQRGFIVR